MLMVTQLCGFGAGGVLTTITLFASATSTSNVIAFPANILAGDLIVLLDRAENQFIGTIPSDVTPTGFTRIGSSLSLLTSGTSGTRSNLWYKLAAGTETGNLTGMDGSTFDDKCMYVFRGDVPAKTITVGDAEGTIVDTDPGDLTCSASAGIAPLIMIGAYGSSGTVDPRGFSTTKDGEITASVHGYLAYKIYNSSPADTVISMDDEGSRNNLHSCYLQMA
jgi:hypothetical protein